MKVRFWGTRGSVPVPGKDTIHYGGNTTCVEVILESGRSIVIDSGTGIRDLGDQLASKGGPVDIHLLITHIHWDHVAGFPFFAPIHNPTTRIAVDGFPSCMKGLRIPFDNKMSDGLFPVKFEDLKAQIRYLNQLNNGPLDVDGVAIEPIALHHPQGGFGFRFREGKKKFVFITDNEIRKRACCESSPEPYVSFCKDADLVVLDAQYTPEEIDSRRGWGHSDYLSALDLAYQAHARRLILFHHDPSRKDADLASIVECCRETVMKDRLDITVHAAEEGSELMV